MTYMQMILKKYSSRLICS